MTEEQKRLKAERDRRYREKKKAEKAAEKDLQADAERYRKELMPEPVLDEPFTLFDCHKRRLEREGRR